MKFGTQHQQHVNHHDAPASGAAVPAINPIQAGICHALVFFGMGVGGMSCNCGAASTGKR